MHCIHPAQQGPAFLLCSLGHPPEWINVHCTRQLVFNQSGQSCLLSSPGDAFLILPGHWTVKLERWWWRWKILPFFHCKEKEESSIRMSQFSVAPNRREYVVCHCISYHFFCASTIPISHQNSAIAKFLANFNFISGASFVDFTVLRFIFFSTTNHRLYTVLCCSIYIDGGSQGTGPWDGNGWVHLYGLEHLLLDPWWFLWMKGGQYLNGFIF